MNQKLHKHLGHFTDPTQNLIKSVRICNKGNLPTGLLLRSCGYRYPQLTVLSRSAIVVWWRFCVVTLLFDFFVNVGAFVIGLSQISSFFSCLRA